jgi:ubiquinone/menaquinone biosynthesis C-methylase UbiE
MDLDRNTIHAIQAQPNAMERRTQQQIVKVKRQIQGLGDGLKVSYFNRAVPAFHEKFGHDPMTIEEVGVSLEDDPIYHAWSDLQITAQTMMWESVGDTVYRERPRITEIAAGLAARRPAGGSLSLDPAIIRPDDALIVDIHGQPGGYMRDEGADDITAGAFYENGGNVYIFGLGIPAKDSKFTVTNAQLLDMTRGETAPKRILDLGSAAGSSTLPYRLEYPNAEVHGVDVGPAMLRYAHARAESLGLGIHFHQMNAVQLGFEDDYFDLVVAHNLFHEVSISNARRIIAEAYRVVKPGGIVIFQDVPIHFKNQPLIAQFMSAWQTINNNEPFWESFATYDLVADMIACGFSDVGDKNAARPETDRRWYLAWGRKPK